MRVNPYIAQIEEQAKILRLTDGSDDQSLQSRIEQSVGRLSWHSGERSEDYASRQKFSIVIEMTMPTNVCNLGLSMTTTGERIQAILEGLNWHIGEISTSEVNPYIAQIEEQAKILRLTDGFLGRSNKPSLPSFSWPVSWHAGEIHEDDEVSPRLPRVFDAGFNSASRSIGGDHAFVDIYNPV